MGAAPIIGVGLAACGLAASKGARRAGASVGNGARDAGLSVERAFQVLSAALLDAAGLHSKVLAAAVLEGMQRLCSTTQHVSDDSRQALDKLMKLLCSNFDGNVEKSLRTFVEESVNWRERLGEEGAALRGQLGQESAAWRRQISTLINDAIQKTNERVQEGYKFLAGAIILHALVVGAMLRVNFTDAADMASSLIHLRFSLSEVAAYFVPIVAVWCIVRFLYGMHVRQLLGDAREAELQRPTREQQERLQAQNQRIEEMQHQSQEQQQRLQEQQQHLQDRVQDQQDLIRILRRFVSSRPLIADLAVSSIIPSSVHLGQDDCSARCCKLNTEEGASALVFNVNQPGDFTVTAILPAPTWATGVATQPRNDCYDQRVKRYSIYTSMDGTAWEHVGNFAGNVTPSKHPVQHTFARPVRAMFVRLQFGHDDYHNHPSLRWEVFGVPCTADN